MKKSSLLVLAFSFVAFSGIVSDAQAGKPSYIAGFCSKLCPKLDGKTDTTCTTGCISKCKAACPPPAKASGASAYHTCLTNTCTLDFVNGTAPADPTAPTDAPAAS